MYVIWWQRWDNLKSLIHYKIVVLSPSGGGTKSLYYMATQRSRLEKCNCRSGTVWKLGAIKVL